MPYKIAGIDVHKKMLAVVVADVEGEGDFQLNTTKLGRALLNCARSRAGSSSARSTKS